MCLLVKLSKLYTKTNRFNKCFCSTSGCKSAPAQYKRHCLVTPHSLSRKQIKTKPMLCKPLLIIYGRVKGLS